MGLSKPSPLYQKVKNYVLKHISSGAWPPGHRIPSERKLVETLGINRITIDKGIKELIQEGKVIRVRGSGTYVSERRPQSDLFEIRNIADEIRSRGHSYGNYVHCLQLDEVDSSITDALGLSVGTRIPHSVIVHLENGIPIQIEDRYVNPLIALNYLQADFKKITPNRYLSGIAAVEKAEHNIEAIIPDEEIQHLLKIEATDACIKLHRRTWVADGIFTVGWLIYPSCRYLLGSKNISSSICENNN